jgi:hypothetical protein
VRSSQATRAALRFRRGTAQAPLDDTEHRWVNLYGPQYIWPLDRSWVVMTDFDLESTYVACDATLAERLLGDDVLEVLPVELTSHINGAW